VSAISPDFTQAEDRKFLQAKEKFEEVGTGALEMHG